MSRPRKFRNVCSLPQVTRFGPLGQAHGREVLNMTVDEYETIRLIDYDGFTQEESGKQMNVARTTVQAIYAEARKKIARSLVDGKIIVIEGGDYKLCADEDNFCGRGCHRQRMHRGGFHGARFNNNINQED